MQALRNTHLKPLVGNKYLWIALAITSIFLALDHLHPQRVGDGSEYYGMFFAWAENHRPWMTSAAFDAYGRLVSEGHISSMVGKEALINAFPQLRLGNTADFNHFWLYSLLAFLASKIVPLAAANNDPHRAFLALHFLLLLCTTSVAFRLYRLNGLIAFSLMTFASPVLWFLDKVHTELFTYCLASLAVMFLLDKRYLMSALMLAVASTQNPSFSLIAFVPFAYRLFISRAQPLTLTEVTLSIGTTLAVLVHPAYYFTRYGIPTPQLLVGGASLGGNLSTFYIWLIDPDIGLFPNWLVGVALLSVTICFAFKRKNFSLQGKKFPGLFFAIYFLVNFYAHSSTTNLNSGATPGVARYALWYLPAFFPLVFDAVSTFPRSARLMAPGLIGLAALSVASILANNPRKPESYSTPTRLSYAIQSKASFLYDPPPEVFLERYSGVGEAVYGYDPRGVLGPDCRKLLIYPGSGRGKIMVTPRCQVDERKLTQVADLLAAHDTVGQPFYHRLDNREFSESRLSSSK